MVQSLADFRSAGWSFLSHDLQLCGVPEDPDERAARWCNRMEISMRKLGLAITASLLLAAPAAGQSIGEKTGVNSVIGITPKTADFVKEVASSKMFAIQSSQLAAFKTQGNVLAFANRMQTDYAKTMSELKSLAQQAGVTVPLEMSSSQQNMFDELNSLSAKKFAKQYLKDQVRVHKGVVSLFKRYGKGGENAQLKDWANHTLHTLQHHLDVAQQLNK